jgi:hypothetical protein
VPSHKQLIPGLFLAAMLASLGVSLSAATVGGVTVPDKVDVDGKSLLLNGAGIRTKFFIKVYVGGLYTTQKESTAGKVLAADAPWRMAFHFLYGVSKSQMCDAWKEGLDDNSPSAPAQVKKDFTQLCDWMEEIPKGNMMSVTYVPGKGATLEVNGKVKGTLAGKPTADAVLSTWIGPKPGPGQAFKKAVLGAQ